MPSPSSPILQQLDSLDKTSSDFQDALSNVLYGQDYVRCARNLQGDDLMWLIAYLDKVFDRLDPCGYASRKCLSELRSICGNRMILPTSYTISSNLLEIYPNAFAAGGFGDVYHGAIGCSKVCIKRIRIYSQDELRKATKIFCKEAVIWARLTHENILPLLGVTINPPQLVSNWMPGGDLPGYVKRRPGADLLRLSSGVVTGLNYLHSRNVIHGDLKGQNVLVDDSGHARIADFGLATVARNIDSMRSASQHGGSSRWTAPEVLDGGLPTKEMDVFSFAMVMIEIFTGAIPFAKTSTVAATLAITSGRRPQRPIHPTLTGDLWELMQRCWNHDPHLRPEISEALKVLTPNEPAWKRSLNNNLSTHERITLITMVFSDHDQVEAAGRLSGADAQTFVDIIDGVLDSLEPGIRGKCLRYLHSVCDHQALVPRSLEIPLCYNPGEIPLYQSICADMWKGQRNGMEVIAKVLRVYSSSDLRKIKRRFCKEVVAWRALLHPNVLPLLGVTMAEDRLVVVSEWMEGGNINEFLGANASVDRFGLLRDATTGLIYMHGQDIIHGNLRGANILINNDGRACLADFALLRIISDGSDDLTDTTTAMGSGTAQWTSPELLVPENFGLKESRPTKESDCYALGVTIYEVLSGLIPFSEYPPVTVTRKVLEGVHPARPEGVEGAWFTDDIWDMLERCWKPQPSDRITADVVLLGLEGSTPPFRPPSDVNGLGGGTTSADE